MVSKTVCEWLNKAKELLRDVMKYQILMNYEQAPDALKISLFLLFNIFIAH